MSEDAEEEEEVLEDDDEQLPLAEELPEGEPAPARGGRMKLIAIVAVAVLVLGGGIAGLLLGGVFGGGEGGSKTAELTLPAPPILYELPEMLVDLKTGRCRSSFLKVQAVVELSEDFVPRLEEARVYILDRLQTFIRQHERIQLVGKAGTELLREGFTRIVNQAIEPDKVANVLFPRIILQ